MSRNRSLLSGWFGGISRNQSSPAPMRPLASIEVLEDRRLLSATAINPGGLGVLTRSLIGVTIPARGFGVTLNLTVGQNFDGYLGDLVGAKVPRGFVISASVNWGDGTAASAGVVSIGATGHIDVGGAHTYAHAGKFAINITLTATPPVTPTPTGAVTAPIILFLGRIVSSANVTSSGGVTLNETAGVPFTAVVGTFSYIAPGTGLSASINWGDGTAPSAGTITPTGVSGVDVINYSVSGSHTYAKVGTYPIVVTVIQSLGPPGSLAPVRLVANIDSTAIVKAAGVNLDGTITGKFSPAPTAANIGVLYLVSGSGSVQAMGPVAATGRIQLPGFMTLAPVSGTLTLTTISAMPGGPSGSVTLTLTGPVEASSGPIPARLSYVIASGTGDFANATGTGTIDLTLGSTALTFTMVINSD